MLTCVYLENPNSPKRDEAGQAYGKKRGKDRERAEKQKRTNGWCSNPTRWHPLILLSHHSIRRGKAESVVLPLSTIPFLHPSFSHFPSYSKAQRSHLGNASQCWGSALYGDHEKKKPFSSQTSDILKKGMCKNRTTSLNPASTEFFTGTFAKPDFWLFA